MATYYVKNGGDDGATGLTDALAWATVGMVNGKVDFGVGDIVLFKRGSTWRELLTVPANSLTFGAYGDGAMPIITGADVFAPVWTDEGLGVYSSPYASTCRGLIVDGSLAYQRVIADKASMAAGEWCLDDAANLLYYQGEASTVADVFTRADSNSALGTASSGQDWTADYGVWGISGNKAYRVSHTGTGTTFATIDSGLTDFDMSVALTRGTNSAGVVIRYVDGVNWITCLHDGTGLSVDKYTAGAWARIGSAVTAWADGDILTVVCAGRSTIVKKNGATLITIDDGDLLAVTKHGLCVGGSIADTGARFDNFRVSDSVPTPAATSFEACVRDNAITDNSKGTITVEDLSLQGANTTYGGCLSILGGGGAWIVRRCELANSAYCGVLLLNSNSEIDSCDIHHNASMALMLNEWGSGQYIHHNDIHHNQIHGFASWGSDSNTIELNTIHHNGWNGVYLEGSAIVGVSSDSNIIRLNDIYDNGQGPYLTDLTQEREVYVAGGDSNQIYYNLIYCTAGHQFAGGIHLDFGAVANLFYHNTITGMVGANACGIVFEDGNNPDNGPTQNNVFKNNIVSNCTVLLNLLTDIADNLQGNVFDYNCYHAEAGQTLVVKGASVLTLAQWQASTSTPDAHSIDTDPLLKADYHLGAASPCKDAGVVIADIGQVVTGAAPDMGRYEYSGGRSGLSGLSGLSGMA